MRFMVRILCGKRGDSGGNAGTANRILFRKMTPAYLSKALSMPGFIAAENRQSRRLCPHKHHGGAPLLADGHTFGAFLT
ncbi:hypothetical protein [Bordetella muralis]|uniref:hypothetical protein n=1 Tax=Bordetella muralis TaxID=1649130 RepID=UPI0039EEA793